MAMELTQSLTELQDRISNLKEKILTEEATKNAFIMPFIQALGYDVFNPLEVIPEFVADVSNKKDEKVDYCIQKDEEPTMIIECKHWKENLNLHNTQLERYFSFTKAKFGVLTNGIIYRFYTDVDEANKMDSKPFLEVDIENLKETSVLELEKFHKKAFDPDSIFDAAGELKYYNAIRIEFAKELKTPSDELVKFFAAKVYNKRFTEKALEQFRRIVKKALNNKITDTINERLNTALEKEKTQQEVEKNEEPDVEDPSKIVLFSDPDKGIYTTQEEINGFEIVKDILKDTIDLDRIAYRDTKSYLGILLDDNNRKAICRLHFNTSQKYLSIIGNGREEKKLPVDKVEHIYKYSNLIVESASSYE